MANTIDRIKVAEEERLISPHASNVPIQDVGTWKPKNTQAAIEQLHTELGNKQSTLVNGETIKSINGRSLLGEGNIEIKEEHLIEKAYTPAEFSGLGRKYLQKNIVSDKNVLTQAMLQDGQGNALTNTIFVIQYDYDLNGGSVTIPAGCTLLFEGGSIKNGTINATRFKANAYGFDNVVINGYIDFTNPINVPIDKPKEFIETILDYKEITSIEPTIFVFAASKTYAWDGVLEINKKNVSLIGGGTIEGTIHLGLSAEDFTDLNYGSYPTTAHFNYVVQGLRFSKYNVIGTSTDSSAIRSYIRSAQVTDANTAISLINVCHVKISDCFFDNVPYPIVYTPNSGYVNQNVRRLNITNCDFEYCHTGIYAPSITKSSVEYGDMMVANCNFFPSHYGIDCECIDGFKVFGCIFNTGAAISGSHPCNIKAFQSGQVVISHNSFYGESNDGAVILESPGNAEIVGNLFSSQSTSQGLVHTEKAALVIRQTVQGQVVDTVNVVGNDFKNVKKPIMVLLEGDIRSYSITGNTMSLNLYGDSRRLMWAAPKVDAKVNNLQAKCNSNLLDTQFDNLAFRFEAIKDYLLNGNANYYPNKATKYLTRIYKYDTKEARINYANGHKPIFVVRFLADKAPSETSAVEFVFNGLPYSADLNSSMSKSDALTAVVNALTSDWGDTYNFSIIGNLLWIVGKTAATKAYTPFYQNDDLTSTNQALVCVYQNLGWRFGVCDTDGKGFIGNNTEELNYNYYGIDGDDDGKRLVFSGKSLTLKATNNNTAGKLYFRNWTAPTSSYNFILLDNDTFFGVDAGAAETSSELVSAIVALAYDDIYTVNNNFLTLINKNEEFYYLQAANFAWYWTWSGHVATYQFLTDDGRVFSPSTGKFNDVGTTANRPSATAVRTGFIYFDETLGKCIVSNGSAWVNLDGTALT